MEETETRTLPSDTRAFLGIGDGANGGTKYDSTVRDPSFGKRRPASSEPSTPGIDERWQSASRRGKPRSSVDMDAFDDHTANERRARAQASAQMLFGTDVSKLDDAGASALYQSVTEGMFGIPDQDGSVAFGKRASKDPRQNIDMLRRFVKGEYSLIEDPEYTKWRQMDDEAKFKYALEHETAGNALKSFYKGERGPSALEVIGHIFTPAPMKFGELRPQQEVEYQRKLRYEDLTEEEKARYRNDVFSDYEKKLSRRPSSSPTD